MKWESLSVNTETVRGRYGTIGRGRLVSNPQTIELPLFGE